MKIGVSGSSGYLAGQLIPFLKEKGHEIVVIDRFSIPVGEPDIIIHLASITNLYECEQNISAAMDSICGFTFLLSKYCIEHKVKLIFASTSTADDSLRSIWSAYDRHKWIAEQIVKEVPNHVILRLSTVYGYSNAESGAGRGIINRWIQNGLAGKDITVYDYVADKHRDYIHVDDVARAFVAAIDAPSGTYDVCTNRVKTIRDAVCDIEWVSNTSARKLVKIVSTPPELHSIDMRDDVLQDSYRWLPKWIPQIQFEEGVRLTAQKYKENMQ